MFNVIRQQSPAVVVQTDEGCFPMREEAGAFAYRDIVASLITEGETVQIDITAQHTGVRRVYFRWNAEIPMTARFLGDHWERGYGDLEWRGVAPDRPMPWYCLMHDKDITRGIGIKTGGSAICFWRISHEYIELCCDVQNGGAGVYLNGRTLCAGVMVGCEGESAFETLKNLCRRMCDAPLMPAAPLYGANNWYYAYGVSSMEQMIEDGKYISSLAQSANRPFVFIDDGWQVARKPNHTGGPWHAGNSAFPDMPGLAARLKAEGTRPGIWIRPLLNKTNYPKSYRLPPRRFKSLDDCCSDSTCFLDPSIPEVLDIVREDIERLSGWGYEMIKHDFTTYDVFGRWGFDMGEQRTCDGWHFYDRSRTSLEIIKDLYAVISGAKGDAMILGCNTIGHAAAGLFEAQRIGDDTSGREWARTRKMGVNTLAFRMAQHGTFFAADADCVGVTSYIPWAWNKEWLSLVAESGTPLIVSIDSKEATAEQNREIAHAFTLAAEPRPIAEPLDWLHTVCPRDYKLSNGEVRRFHWE